MREFLSKNKALLSFLFLSANFAVFLLSSVATYGIGTFVKGIITGSQSPSPLIITEPPVTIFAKVVSPFVPPGEEPVEQACAVSFRTTQGWYEHPPAVFEIRFLNKGNTHLVPGGVIEIFNSRDERVAVIPINPEGEVVLPGEFHLFEEPWSFSKWCCGFIPRLGLYTARAQLTYGSGPVVVDLGPISFWIIPWKFLLIVSAILLLGLISLPLFFLLWPWHRRSKLLTQTFIKEIESRERPILLRRILKSKRKPKTLKK